MIEQPCLCLFGVTTPAVFWGSLSSGNVMDGSLARMLIFESDNHYPDVNHDPVENAPPASLVDAMQAISKGAEGFAPFPMGEGPAQVPKPYTVPYFDMRAAARARAMREEQIDMLRANQGTQVTGIIARLAENAAKIALVRAITNNPARPAITCDDLDWGMVVANRSVQTLMSAIKERVADNEYEAKLKKIHKVIADAGSAGIIGRDLSFRTRFVDKRQRTDILAHLEESGMITVMEMHKAEGARGFAAKVYFDAA